MSHQAPSGGGQPRGNLGQPFFIPTLMSSLQQQQQQQPVVITCSGNATAPVVISSHFGGQSSGTTTVSSISVIQQSVSVAPANLYLCAAANNATDPPREEDGGSVKKVSVEILEESYKELNSRKIKDSLSSFLPDMPGEFDAADSAETKLRHLLDRRLIGNKEFHPLSGHALLGFRLLPGPLPEQYRIDPPLQEIHSHHHRKKKHKHKNLDKPGEDGSDLNPPSTKVKMPGDAYTFVKQEPSSSLLPPSTHGYPSQGERVIPPKVVPSGHVYPSAITAAPTIVSSTTVVGHDPLKKKKEKKKKDEKKKKKKKKDKHHSQDLPVVGAAPSQTTPHPPPSYSMP